MIKNIKESDILIHMTSGKYAKVLFIDEKYGCFKVEYLTDKYVKWYTMDASGRNAMFDDYVINNLNDEERADLFLKLENAGVTDYWRE